MRELRVLPRPDQATPRQVRLINAAVAVWTVVCLGAAVLVAWDVYHLDRWSDLLQSTAASLDRTGRVLGSTLGARAELANLAAQSRSSAASARDSVHELAYLLGMAIALIPTLPVLALMVRFRTARRKERAALIDALNDPAERASVIRYLGERAVDRRSLCDLLEVFPGDHPFEVDFAGGITREPELGDGGSLGTSAEGELLERLAEAEAVRLGIDPGIARPSAPPRG